MLRSSLMYTRRDSWVRFKNNERTKSLIRKNVSLCNSTTVHLPSTFFLIPLKASLWRAPDYIYSPWHPLTERSCGLRPPLELLFSSFCCSLFAKHHRRCILSTSPLSRYVHNLQNWSDEPLSDSLFTKMTLLNSRDTTWIDLYCAIALTRIRWFSWLNITSNIAKYGEI